MTDRTPSEGLGEHRARDVDFDVAIHTVHSLAAPDALDDAVALTRSSPVHVAAVEPPALAVEFGVRKPRFYAVLQSLKAPIRDRAASNRRFAKSVQTAVEADDSPADLLARLSAMSVCVLRLGSVREALAATGRGVVTVATENAEPNVQPFAEASGPLDDDWATLAVLSGGVPPIDSARLRLIFDGATAAEIARRLGEEVDASTIERDATVVVVKRRATPPGTTLAAEAARNPPIERSLPDAEDPPVYAAL